MNMRHLPLLMSIACAMLFIVSAPAQTPRLLGRDALGSSRDTQRNAFKTDKDSIDPNSIPKGLTVWTIDERFGSVRPAEPDTLSHLFQNSNFTEGVHGTYNFLGTQGSPRISRIYSGAQDYMMDSQFIFTRPYSYYLRPTDRMVFTNTKSPIAHLTYHSAGGKQTGDDRFTADFATNLNKRAGVGFVIDYAYGRGNYKNQPNSAFGGTLYGSYRGDQYQMHAFFNSNHLKTVENGGLEDDGYIVNPEAYPTRYQSSDIPVRLEGVRNTLNVWQWFLSHRYSVGFYEYVDSVGRVVHQTQRPTGLTVRPTAGDTLAKSLAAPAPFMADTTLTRRFVPVASLIHTFRLAHNDRIFSSQTKQDAFFQNFFYTADKANDKTRSLSLQNTIALEMQEGFRRWVKTGMRLFAKHELARFTLPNAAQKEETTTFNYITLGAQLMREKAKTLRYNVLGEMRTTGTDWGEFNLEGNVGLHFRLGSDTLSFEARGFVRNENPAFYYEHFHSRNAWWDKNLDKVFRFRAEGRLSYGSTRLGVGLETVQNHIFLQETQTAGATPATQATMKYGVDVQQTSTNIQLISATLGKDFRLGILNWENELTFQKSSNDRALPLPLLTAWSNLYLKFKVARVLATELGTDVRYFTRYYAPTYSPMVGMFALQDATYRTQLGNYPWVNAYVNFTLKGVRFYVAYAHLNQGNGRYFLAPHYPTNPSELRVGISWTFFN